jgi:hypothetical protein
MKIDRPSDPRSFAAAAALALLVAACATPAPPGSLRPESTAPTDAPTPTPVVESAGPGDAMPCTDADLALEHGFADGAAGSRFTIMTLTVTGSAACSLEAIPTVELVDATGAQVAIGAPAGQVASVDVQPGTVLISTIQFNNWCEELTAEPLALALVIDESSITVAGGPFPNPGGLPPCNGPGGPTLMGTAWELPPT